ncbi:MAG: G-D-S-L family lipolytic protein [Sphaerochaetaceae bacterium]|nr:G-D-S-L family lipolytic protein [Sphaerochaetaceae bacterium]
MKHILCFGDSNTFGSKTESIGRYDYADRWTIKLNKLLGEDFHIIEEGLGGRTTVFDDPFEPGKRGLDDIDNILDSHKPLDLVIVMLGTNDTKQVFNASVKSIAYGLEVIIERIRAHECGEPEILIISPILIAEDVENSRFVSFDKSSHFKSLEFASCFEKTAKKMDTFFFDAAMVAHCGSDSLHMTKESHDSLAKALLPVVKDILS